MYFYEGIKLRILLFSDTFRFLPVLFHPFTHFCNAKGSDFMSGISETKNKKGCVHLEPNL